MSTLLMRLAAPMQAWGLESKFDTRRTAREPTKSGVVGLVAAALGIRRDEEDRLAELAALRFGVRVDREGVMVRDFHTARRAVTEKDMLAYVTNRYYLSDAVFVAGLESEDEALLCRMEEALHHPVFPLYLGRRACPPVGRLCLGIMPGSLETALTALPPQTDRPDDTMRLLVDAEMGTGGGIVRDVPVSFDPRRRQFAFRQVRESVIRPMAETTHDPMAEGK